MLYFDHNATAPLAPAARAAWLEACDRFPANPSSPHRLGSRAEAALGEAAGRVAACLGCGPLDVVWTSGATEAANLAMHHYARALPPEAVAVVSAIEHPCVRQAARRHLAGRVVELPVTKAGVARLDWLADRLGAGRVGLVALMAANNETGVLQPWHEVLKLCRQTGVPLVCDATQWLGRLPARGLGECDMVLGSAHKYGGPRGVGFLKCPGQGGFHSLVVGGPQQAGRRAGTENVPGAVALVAALSECEQRLANGEAAAREAWHGEFEQRLLSRLPGSRVVGHGTARLWNTVAAIMPPTPCPHRWVVKLDKAGFAVSTGSACASGKEAPSHVLSAMGCDAEEAARVLRFSSGWPTTREDWSRLADGLAEVYAGWTEPGPGFTGGACPVG